MTMTLGARAVTFRMPADERPTSPGREAKSSRKSAAPRQGQGGQGKGVASQEGGEATGSFTKDQEAVVAHPGNRHRSEPEHESRRHQPHRAPRPSRGL